MINILHTICHRVELFLAKGKFDILFYWARVHVVRRSKENVYTAFTPESIIKVKYESKVACFEFPCLCCRSARISVPLCLRDF